MTDAVPMESVVLLLAILARVAPAIWVAPFLGGRFVPATVKLAVSLMLAAVLYPSVAPSAAALERLSSLALGAVVLKEALVGAALGFVVAVAFWAAEAAGWLADRARAGEQGAPSPLANLLLLLTVIIFVSLGGHHIFITALAGSYEALPLVAFPSAEGVAGFALLSMRLTGDLLLVAVTLAAPVLATLWLADLLMGLAGRHAAAGGFFVTMPIRAVLGVLVVALVLGVLGEVIPEVLERGVDQVERAVEQLGTRN